MIVRGTHHSEHVQIISIWRPTMNLAELTKNV